MQSEFSGRHVASFLDMGIVKWCHPGEDHVSMPPFGRYYRKKLHSHFRLWTIGGEWCLLLHQPPPPFGMICFGSCNR
jgi:hypothetical protein